MANRYSIAEFSLKDQRRADSPCPVCDGIWFRREKGDCRRCAFNAQTKKARKPVLKHDKMPTMIIDEASFKHLMQNVRFD
jgi:hypothetical protein